MIPTTWFFVINEIHPNHVDFLVWCLLIWPKSSRHKSIQRDFSRSDSFETEFIFSAPIFFNFKNILAPSVLKNLLCPFFLLIYVPWHGAFLLEKYNIPVMDLKRSKPPARYSVVSCIWWFQVRLSQCLHYHYARFLPFVLQDNFLKCWGRCSNHHVPIFQWNWSHGQSVLQVLLIVSSKLTPVLLKGCASPISIISGPEGSVMSSIKVISTSSRLV